MERAVILSLSALGVPDHPSQSSLLTLAGLDGRTTTIELEGALAYPQTAEIDGDFGPELVVWNATESAVDILDFPDSIPAVGAIAGGADSSGHTYSSRLRLGNRGRQAAEVEVRFLGAETTLGVPGRGSVEVPLPSSAVAPLWVAGTGSVAAEVLIRVDEDDRCSVAVPVLPFVRRKLDPGGGTIVISRSEQSGRQLVGVLGSSEGALVELIASHADGSHSGTAYMEVGPGSLRRESPERLFGVALREGDTISARSVRGDALAFLSTGGFVDGCPSYRRIR